MAKSRAQRKADRRKREEELQRRARESQAKARSTTATEVEQTEVEPAGAEAVEDEHEDARPAALGDIGPIDPVIESELVSAEPVKRSRREERREAKERERRARESQKRREGTDRAPVKERGAISGFFVSVWRELQKVQWPDQPTLVQASAVTIIFVAVAAAYLGALDAVFNQLIKAIL